MWAHAKNYGVAEDAFLQQYLGEFPPIDKPFMPKQAPAPPRLKSEPVWHSSRGEIAVADMETAHLENTIDLLKRRAMEEARNNGKSSSHWRTFVQPIYNDMMQERKRRGP